MLVNDLTNFLTPQERPVHVLTLVGSLRAGSWTAAVTDHLLGRLPQSTTRTDVALGELPHYSEDLDTDEALPDAVRRLRADLERADVALVATPEYNGSLPGALKNALDWASRPRGAAALAGKPTAVLSVSPSPRGAQWAREDAVKVLGVAGAEVLGAAVGVPNVNRALEESLVVDEQVDADLDALVATLLDAARSSRPAA